jgi:hypothetical protein
MGAEDAAVLSLPDSADSGQAAGHLFLGGLLSWDWSRVLVGSGSGGASRHPNGR